MRHHGSLSAVLGTVALLSVGAAEASDSANIQACIAAVQSSTGRVVDAFDATYQRRLLQTNIARWPGVVCEVGDGKVWKLSVDGAPVVTEGWPSPEAKAAYDQLDAETANAIRTLETRKQLIADRLAEAGKKLRRPGADIAGLSAYVRDGIGKALGQQ